ncbi:MAG: hypothetical protein HRF47_06495, partial [Chloroflexota bacterium]
PPSATPTVVAAEPPQRGFSLWLFLAIALIVIGGGGLLWSKLPRSN